MLSLLVATSPNRLFELKQLSLQAHEVHVSAAYYACILEESVCVLHRPATNLPAGETWLKQNTLQLNLDSIELMQFVVWDLVPETVLPPRLFYFAALFPQLNRYLKC